MGKYKDELIKSLFLKGFEVGDKVKAKAIHFGCDKGREDDWVAAVITSISNDIATLTTKPTSAIYLQHETSNVVVSELSKDTFNVGVNPFTNDDFWRQTETLKYDLEGIMLMCGIYEKGDTYRKHIMTINGYDVPDYNDNPFIIDKDGNRQYYQRPYVWTLADEQSFIDSIYNGIECGRIMVRRRGYDYVEKRAMAGDFEGLAWHDIVDGKQRLNTIKRFVNDEFPDSNGYYFSDLSEYAKRVFNRSSCLSLVILREKATDEDVLKAFLMTNYAGKPMSKEHIEYVKEIFNNVK